MRNLEKIATLLQKEVSDLKGRVGSLEAQVQLLQVDLLLKEGTSGLPEKLNRANTPEREADRTVMSIAT